MIHIHLDKYSMDAGNKHWAANVAAPASLQLSDEGRGGGGGGGVRLIKLAASTR